MHDPECIWRNTTVDECEYRAIRSECPHIEHSCTCENLRKLRRELEESKQPAKVQPKNAPEEAWIASVNNSIQNSRKQNSDLRFGQLLYNLIAKSDQDKDGQLPNGYDEEFHIRLFNIRDEELIKLFKKYGKTGEL